MLLFTHSNERTSTVADKDALKPQLVPAMIALSGASDKAIRAQIAESVSLIAELDFPERWPDLIDVRQLNERTLTDFTHILPPGARTIPQQQRHEHQPRCTRDRTLYLPRVAFARAFGCVLVDHQTRAQQIPRALFPAFRDDC